MLLSPSSIIVTEHPTFPQTMVNTLLTTAVNPCAHLTLTENLRFFQKAIGGVFVAGARYLLSGSPGGGKSRLVTQLCLDLARQDIPSLTILTEETPAQMKRRAQEMTSNWDPLDISRTLSHVYVDHTLFEVSHLPNFFTRQVLAPEGMYHGVKLIVLDSIQGQGLAASATKSYAKVIDFARICADNGITTLLLSHQTKNSDIAGPKALEHGIDVSLCLRRAMKFVALTIRKNRYGPVPQPPRPLGFNSQTIRLEPVPQWNPTPAMARTYAGAATGVLELQASVSLHSDGLHGKTTAPGLPKKEIEQLVNGSSSIKDLDMADLDYVIHCRLPGNGRYQSMFGLPLCMALIGSYLQKPVPERNMYIGEIDLFRQVRSIAPAISQALKSALDTGDIATPITLFLPPLTAVEFKASESVRVVPCDTLETAVFHTWPELR